MLIAILWMDANCDTVLDHRLIDAVVDTDCVLIVSIDAVVNTVSNIDRSMLW